MKITALNLRHDWAHVTNTLGITPPVYPRLYWSWWGVSLGWGALRMIIERDFPPARSHKDTPK